MPGDCVAGCHGAVQPDAGAAGGAVGRDPAGVWLEVALWVLGGDTALDRVPLRLGNVLLQQPRLDKTQQALQTSSNCKGPASVEIHPLHIMLLGQYLAAFLLLLAKACWLTTGLSARLPMLLNVNSNLRAAHGLRRICRTCLPMPMSARVAPPAMRIWACTKSTATTSSVTVCSTCTAAAHASDHRVTMDRLSTWAENWQLTTVICSPVVRNWQHTPHDCWSFSARVISRAAH